MTQNPEIFYYYQEETRTMFWSTELLENVPDLIFIGSSVNPNKKMAVSAFVKTFDKDYGYKIKEIV